MNKSKFFQHSHALVEADEIGAGTRIWAFAHLLKGAKVGRNCNIGDHVFIEGGTVIGNRVTIKNGAMIWEGVNLESDVFVGPNVVFTNDRFPRSARFSPVANKYRNKAWVVPTHVGRGASIGANATIVCGVTIGRFSMIGAGALVTGDVPSHALVAGVPAEIKGWVTETGERLRFDLQGLARCPKTGAMWRLKGKKLMRVRRS